METLRPARDVQLVLLGRIQAGILPALAHVVVLTVLAVGFFPMAFWFAGLGLAIAEWRYQGLWPIHRTPYPYHRFSELPLGWLEWLAPLLVFLLVAIVVQVTLHLRLRKRWWILVAPTIAAGLWASGLVLLNYDPWSIVAWYFT